MGDLVQRGGGVELVGLGMCLPVTNYNGHEMEVKNETEGF